MKKPRAFHETEMHCRALYLAQNAVVCSVAAHDHDGAETALNDIIKAAKRALKCWGMKVPR